MLIRGEKEVEVVEMESGGVVRESFNLLSGQH